jgi:16S rRNA (cytosine967-C5)-methyltransferase
MAFNDVITYLRFRDGVDGEEYLSSIDADYKTTEFKNCFALTNFSREDGFFDGKYTFQSIGSIAICNIVEEGVNLLDTCAAPGGKSNYLAERFSKVTACDIHSHRVQLIEEYSRRMNIKNVEALQMDATVYNPDFFEKFDAVLCDVPCSGFGVVYENPDMKLNREYDDVKNINALQLSILKNVCRYVKKGGYLVYSTCSVFSCENQAIIDKFLLENKDFCVEDINSKLANIKVKNGLQFLPHVSGGGFFVCKLKKI